MKDHYTLDDLKGLVQKHDSFVGVDSDGCVFDTMTAKQKVHFHPLIIKFWGLEACEPALRACAEFVNLYSKTRGSNRFPALLRTFELLRKHPDACASGAPMPEVDALRRYIESGLPLGNPSLQAEAGRTRDPELQRVLAWSLAINEDIHANMRPVPPYPAALHALQMIHQSSDLLVVSQTPEVALVNEWNLHGIHQYVDLIAGQELGTKAEHIEIATAGKYASGRVLMIGDAQGDQAAAKQTGALFYPITPGQETVSWERFCDDAYARFLNGTYAGEYAAALASEFDASLPDTPPW